MKLHLKMLGNMQSQIITLLVLKQNKKIESLAAKNIFVNISVTDGPMDFFSSICHVFVNLRLVLLKGKPCPLKSKLTKYE